MKLEIINSRNQNLERGIICRVLLTRQILPQLIPEYFFGEERRLFDALWEQWQAHGEIDIEAIRPNLNESTIAACLDSDATGSNAAIEELRTHWMRRELARTVAALGECEHPEQAAKDMQERIAGIIAGKRDKKYIHSETISRLESQIDEAQKQNRRISGYTIGLKDFDDHTGGIERGKMYVLAALKKTGKSRFMIYTAIRLCEQGAGVMLNSLEMNTAQLNTLALAHYSGVNSKSFSSMLNGNEMFKCNQSWEKVKNLNWLIYREYEMSQLKSRILHERHNHNIDVVIVDFIQRMRSPRFRLDRVREVEDISQQLADMSRDLNIGIIVLSQLSGTAEHLKKNEMPNLGHIKESQAISENADSIIIMHNPDRHTSPVDEAGNYTPPNFKFRIEQRYGFSGVECNIAGDLRTCNFWEEEF